MAKHTPVRIEHAGKRWSATFEVEGKDVVVSSAYGSARAPFGRRKPERVAAEMLTAIVKARGR